MSLSVESLSFRNFRNYRCFSLEDIGRITLLVGPNAVGKTNVVEGIQLLTAIASFRHPKLSYLVREGATSAQARMTVGDGSRELSVDMIVEEGKRRYLLNGKAKRPADLKGMVPSVTFTPDDLAVVKGGNAGRRALVDALGSQLSANHYRIVKDYEQVLRSKNRLLKEEADPLLIESIDEMVIRVGAQLTCYRAALFARLMPYIEHHYQATSRSGDIVTGRYVPSWVSDEGAAVRSGEVPSRDEAREAIAFALGCRRAEERARRKAVVGPHSDRIELFVDGRDASTFASQGQQRTIVLAIKFAEVSLIEEVLDQRPVLLLDDVMSELDATRRRALVEHIESGFQTFITTTNLSYFDDDLVKKARVVELSRETFDEDAS